MEVMIWIIIEKQIIFHFLKNWHYKDHKIMTTQQVTYVTFDKYFILYIYFTDKSFWTTNWKPEAGKLAAIFDGFDHTFNISLTFTMYSFTNIPYYWYGIFHITSGPDKGTYGSRYPSLWFNPLLGLGAYFDYSPDEQNQKIFHKIEKNKPVNVEIRHFEEIPGNWIFEYCVNYKCESKKYDHPGKKDIILPKMYLYMSTAGWSTLDGIIHSFEINTMGKNIVFNILILL